LRSLAGRRLFAWRRPFPLLHLSRSWLWPRFLLTLNPLAHLILQIA
jgi:hypothetical protein